MLTVSNNFWDSAVSGDEKKPQPNDEKQLISDNNKDSQPSKQILFTNPLVIEVDGKRIELPLKQSNELSQQAINFILTSKEFWIIELMPEGSFFQMDVNSSVFEYWADGEMNYQQKGDVSQAFTYLESIIAKTITGKDSQKSNSVWSNTESSAQVNSNSVSDNSTTETNRRILEMREIDVEELSENSDKTMHHFFNIPIMVFTILSFLTSFYFADVTQDILGLIIAGFISLLLLAYSFATHVRIDHYPAKNIFVWYKGIGIDFVYQKQSTDRLAYWEDVTVTQNSEGADSVETSYRFRLEDKHGNELYSGEGAGAGSKGLNNRQKMITILGLQSIRRD